MKLLFFDDFKLGVLKGDTVVDVSQAVRDIPHTGPHDLISGLIERFADYRGALEKAAAAGNGAPVAQVRIRPPLPRPVNIDCMAVNYMEDGTRKEPAPINAFHKSPSAVIGDDDTMVLPDVPATIFEGEAEMALVIGKRAANVPAAKAMDYVFGYLNFIDGSARGLPPTGNTFYQMKSRDTFAPLGPYIVTADEVKDPHNLQVRLWVNGTLDAELQHQRHGAQDPALHRMGNVDPCAGAGRRPGAGNQSPRPEPVPGRRLGGARNRASRPATREDPRRSQTHMGKGNTAAATGKRIGSANAAAHWQVCKGNGITAVQAVPNVQVVPTPSFILTRDAGEEKRWGN